MNLYQDQNKFNAEFKSGFYSRRETENEINEIIRKNRATLEGIQEKIEGIETILKKSSLKHLSDSKYFYFSKDWPAIFNVFKRIESALYRLVENPKISFSGDNNITHFLGNGIQTYSKLVDYYLKKIIDIFENKEDNVADKIEPYLEENKREYFQKNKRVWDYTLYYLDYMSDEENSWMFAKEITDESGFLGEKGIKECIVKNPREDLDRLKFINFFVRLEGSWNSGLKDFIGTEGICESITEENFDQEFDKMNAENYLDRELARKYMRKCQQEKINQALN